MNKVLHYSKSDWDGANKSNVSIYFKEGNWIEFVKWTEDESDITIIPVRIDPQSLGIVEMKNISCDDGGCLEYSEVMTDGSNSSFVTDFCTLGDNLTCNAMLSKNDDFNWVSLMVGILTRGEPVTSAFDRYNFSMNDGQLSFGRVGEVEMKYLIKMRKDAVLSHILSINGPGLNNRRGEIWFDANSEVLRGIRVDLPEDDSYNSVTFKFDDMENMSPIEWEYFKNMKVCNDCDSRA